MNVSVQFRYQNKIKNLLIKNSPDDNESVVYKIKCKKCCKDYIGTSGNLTNRIAQHKYAIKSRNNNNAMFVHYLETGHMFDFNNTELIAKSKSFTKRNLLEGTCINLTWENNVNLDKGVYTIDDVGINLLNKEINLNN